MGALHGIPRRFLFISAGLTLLAAIVRIPVLGEGAIASDTSGYYLPVAESLVGGAGFPDNIRPPGFPLLLAALDWLGADPILGIVLIQNLVGIVLPTLVLFIGWRYFSLATGALAGFLAAASPLALVTEQVALPDYLFGVLFLVGATLLAEAAIQLRGRRRPLWLLLAVGIVFGLATLLRPNGQLALVLIPLALLLGARAWRPALRSSALALAAFLLVLSPWILHNVVEHGNPSISTESGISLYGRVITSEKTPPPAKTVDGQIALGIYNTGGPTVAVYNAFLEEGRSPEAAAAAMGSLAREAIFREPGEYAIDTLDILGQFVTVFEPYLFDPEDQADRVHRNFVGAEGLPSTPGASPLTNVPWQVAQVVTAIVFYLALAGLVILFLPFVGSSRSRLAGAVFLLVGGLGLIGSALLVRFEPRFGIIFAPLAWILFSAAAVFAASRLAGFARQGQWRRLAPRRGPASS